jgi:hypothetical protein
MVDQHTMEGFEGKRVDLQLRYTNAREHGIFGLKVLSVGPRSFVLEDSWPIPVKHSQVVSVKLADTGTAKINMCCHCNKRRASAGQTVCAPCMDKIHGGIIVRR